MYLYINLPKVMCSSAQKFLMFLILKKTNPDIPDLCGFQGLQNHLSSNYILSNLLLACPTRFPKLSDCCPLPPLEP